LFIFQYKTPIAHMNAFFKTMLFALCVAGITVVYATQPAYPIWWTDTGNGTNITLANATVNNFAPVNIGQFKNVATKARVYLDNQLASVGGAGPYVDSIVDGFTHNTTSAFAPVDLGQLKAVAQPFYDRLTAVEYNTTLNLQNHTYPTSWNSTYAWSSNATSATNHMVVNIGQVKLVFSFDLSSYTIPTNLDANGDGVPDATKLSEGLSPFAPSGDSDGDGYPDSSDAFPLDPGFNALPVGSASDPHGPQITLWTPAHAIKIM
jgi:hypothetical protein